MSHASEPACPPATRPVYVTSATPAAPDAPETPRSDDASVSSGGWRLEVWVQPGAAATGCVGLREGRLKLKLAAPAVDNKANKALVRFVAARLGVKPRDVDLVRGRKSRAKTLHIHSHGEPDWEQLERGSLAG